MFKSVRFNGEHVQEETSKQKRNMMLKWVPMTTSQMLGGYILKQEF